MGTLDDAIRQHLELKRRAGAPETEVERIEAEALGPGRRDAPDPAAEAPAPPAAPVPDLPPAPTEPPGAVEPPDLSASPGLGSPPPPAPAPPPAAPAPTPTGDAWLEDDEDAPEIPPVPSQPTDEFTAGDAREASGAPPTDFVDPDEEGDDLLEETPEFLQETPEHDRLWFEQKPPRDFDFDS